ncbi:S-adenosyl-L-methionine-dependent methyltransferase [Mycena chlorophos]|uniref:S-adenosyl-L-methionine-dependent methyltransferase n=1 Tax=Mycena chlorophos TaxID=658473 RepID=A0A8H6RWT9_MYCCL|nr:S-adenosyl-L-methionine-dependent methyltransferase [Mycena chlorophos]
MAAATVAPSAIEHSVRQHQENPASKYALPVDEPEGQRLISQHWTCKSLFGGRLVWAPIEFTKDTKVLENATGTGIWLLDLASSIDASVEMQGIDIESRLFAKSLPKNISLRVGNLLSHPADWTNTFDLLNQRFLMVALEIPQWPQALTEMLRVLKPGGWVQICEPSAWRDASPDRTRPGLTTLNALVRALGAQRNLFLECGEAMPGLLEAAGFVDVHKEVRSVKMGAWGGDDGVKQMVNYIDVFRGLKTPILKAGGYGLVSTEADFDALIEGLEAELEGTEGDVLYSIFWARKPIV